MYIRKDEPTRMLVIDDADDDDLQDILQNLQMNFPAANIEHMKGFNGIEEKIIEGQYHVIFLDGTLHNWGSHKVFDRYGWKMIPFIQQQSPHTCIVAISSMTRYNDHMLTAGAIKSINKELLLRRTEIREDLSVA